MSSEAKRTEARRCTEAMRDLLIAFRDRMEGELRSTGVTLAQLRLLKAVEGEHEVSAAAIARLCNVTPQTLHTMLTRAAREGWITRGSSDRNHRFVTAALTPAGEAILSHGLGLKERIESEIWRGVSRRRLREVREVLEMGVAKLGEVRAEPEQTARHPTG